MIPQDVARKVLGEGLKNGGGPAETHVEDRRSISLTLEDSKVKEAARGIDQGTEDGSQNQ